MSCIQCNAVRYQYRATFAFWNVFLNVSPFSPQDIHNTHTHGSSILYNINILLGSADTIKHGMMQCIIHHHHRHQHPYQHVAFHWTRWHTMLLPSKPSQFSMQAFAQSSRTIFKCCCPCQNTFFIQFHTFVRAACFCEIWNLLFWTSRTVYQSLFLIVSAPWFHRIELDE